MGSFSDELLGSLFDLFLSPFVEFKTFNDLVGSVGGGNWERENETFWNTVGVAFRWDGHRSPFGAS